MKPTISLPTFPKTVEDWWWAQAKQKWTEVGEEKLLNLIRQEIVEQSDRFNKNRSFESSSYGKRDLSIISYGNFYFSRTWIATLFGIAETISRSLWSIPKNGPIRILDIGSGSGASGLACLSLLRNQGVTNPVELHAWDYSSKSLNYLKDLHRSCSDLWPNSRVHSQRLDLRYFPEEKVKQKFDLILFGFSFNEITQDQEIEESTGWLEQSVQLLKRSGRMVITEPAESEICRNLHTTTYNVVTGNKDLSLMAPYFNGLPCPMTLKNSKYFSHEVRTYKALAHVEKINRLLHLEIREVKFGLSILGYEHPKVEDQGPNLFRLISPVKKRKGTISFMGMGSDGIEYLYEFQRRDLEKEMINDYLAMERGDIFRIIGSLSPNENHRIRLLPSQDIQPLFVPRLKN